MVGNDEFVGEVLQPPAPSDWGGFASNQRDSKTPDALIGRLSKEDPQWLESQVIGTLSGVTGKDFDYAAGQWLRWWQSVRRSWDS